MLPVIFLTAFVPFCLSQSATTAPLDVVGVLAARSSESVLVDLIKTAGLADALSQGGPFTIFAPSNTAFNKLKTSVAALKNDTKLLAEILKYHVVNGIYKLNDLHVNELMLDSLSGTKIRINYYFTARKHVTAEGSRIIYSNKMASNGVIHIVSDVLMPPAGDIVDVLSADSDFSTLLGVVNKVGLAAALQDGPYTLLAPNNMAFAKLGNDTITKLMNNPDILKKILLYHVIPGTIYADGMHSGYLHTLEEDDRIRISSSFFGLTVHIDSTTNVVKEDISASNGVVHKIDHVLIPYSIRTQIKNL